MRSNSLTTATDQDTDAGVGLHGDDHTIARLRRSRVMDLVRAVARLPSITSVEVFPDVAAKSWGFPSGLVTTSSGDDPFVYPMAAPDVACGFNVIATGLHARHWDITTLRSVYTAVVAAIAADSPDRTPAHLNLDDALAGGVEAMPEPRAYTYGQRQVETQAVFTADPALLSPASRQALAEQAGSVAGHFVSLYTVADILRPAQEPCLFTGEIVLIVHTGAPALREHLDQTHTVPMAAHCLDEGIVPDKTIEAGLFGVPLSHPLARSFLALTGCAVNYGYLNRHLVAERILTLLDSHARPGQRAQDARLIRHIGHCAYQPGTSDVPAVVTARGIQPTRWSGDAEHLPGHPTTFITGSDHTHAYLVTAGPNAEAHGWRCGHGTPQWTTTHAPPHLEGSPWVDPQAALTHAERTCANTEADPARLRSDLINLEATIAAMHTTGMAVPTARLLPLMNYQEPRHA